MCAKAALNENKSLCLGICSKNTGKWEKTLEKSGNFVSPESGNPGQAVMKPITEKGILSWKEKLANGHYYTPTPYRRTCFEMYRKRKSVAQSKSKITRI